jgi:cytochrome b561
MPDEPAGGYAPFVKFLHWLIAGILVVQFTLGCVMPPVRRGMERVSMHTHIAIGIVVLVLTIVRLLWRVTHPVPPEPELLSLRAISAPAAGSPGLPAGPCARRDP